MRFPHIFYAGSACHGAGRVVPDLGKKIIKE
jgi:hypothetical protein